MSVTAVMPYGLRGREAHSRSLAKAISWRTTGTIDTFVLSFIITGSFKFAGSIALTEVLTKITLYYLHERAWSAISWGRIVAGASREREAHVRSLLKAISWRTTGTIDTFILSLIITGSFKFAGSIAATEVITKIVLYYVHERAWSAISWGRH